MQMGVIGCGSMGSAFVKGSAKGSQWLLFDKNLHKAKGLASLVQGQVMEDVERLIRRADVILLAIKPKDFKVFAENVRHQNFKGKIIVSLMTGASVARCRQVFIGADIVRLMPSLAVTCKLGVIAVVEDKKMQKQTREWTENFLSPLGNVIWMQEDKIDAFIAVSASGIGFIFALMQALYEGSLELGFDAQNSRQLIIDTVEGAMALARHSSNSFKQLKEQVASPGGTTEAGLNVMQKENIAQALISTLHACHERSVQITREIERGFS